MRLFFLVISLAGGLVAGAIEPIVPVTVYIMDNGVRTDHKAFRGISIESVDLTGTSSRSVKKKRLVIGGGDYAFGDHATLLAGLIAERAPESKLVSVRTLDDEGKGSWSEFVKGVHWIINHHVGGQPAVANLSLGGSVDDPRIQRLLTRAIEQLVAEGVTVVVAAGNDGIDDERRFPSTLDSVISVGAVSMFDRRLDSSNFGSCVDVYALGKDLEGPGSFSNVFRTRDSGTSMAAAVVAGHVAAHMLKEAKSSPEQIKQWVLDNSDAGQMKNVPAEAASEALLFRRN